MIFVQSTVKFLSHKGYYDIKMRLNIACYLLFTFCIYEKLFIIGMWIKIRVKKTLKISEGGDLHNPTGTEILRGLRLKQKTFHE